MWKNCFVYNPRNFVRFFSVPSQTCRYGMPSSNIPMISPLLNHRMLGKSHFMSTVDEETILELLENISEIPIPASEYKYVNFADIPRQKKLPFLPKSLNEESIIKYTTKLVSFRYPRVYTNQISEALLEIVTSSPQILSKELYLKIILFHHFHTNHKAALQILNLMIANTEIKQDIDFDNVLMSGTVRPPMYRQVIERLEVLKDKDWKANSNTWYSLFHMFKNPEPKVKMIELMKEYEVPAKPLLGSLVSIIDYFTPEQLIELYDSEGITLENGQMDSGLFNQLVACYLKDFRIDEVWSIIQNSPDAEKWINVGLFVTFANHFLKNNQLAFAFAFSDFMQKKYKLNTYPVLTSMILNVYLKDCPYFDRWISITRIFMPSIKKNYVFLNSKTISNLNDYCDIHNINNNFNIMESEDHATKKAISTDLVWRDKPIFELLENTPQFVKTAELIGQRE